MNVYLDYAATTPLDGEVLEAMLPFYKDVFGNADSLHAYGRRAAYFVAEARAAIAHLLGVRAGEVYFTSGGTEADNWAVQRLGGGSVLLSSIEHAAAMEGAKLRAGGYRLLPVDEQGAARVAGAEEALSRGGVGLVCLMAVNNETGVLQPVEEAARLAHAHGALLFSDCVQAACTQDLSAVLRHADAISLSAHKLYGPKGVGALIVKGGALSPLIAGGEQERGLRGGTLNVAGVCGFAAALKRAQEGRAAFCKHTEGLRDRFEAQILAKNADMVRVDGENRAPNISHLTFARGTGFVHKLDLMGVACSSGAACSAHSALPSHVMRAMGRSEEEALRGVRFSFGRETTREQVDYAAQAVLTCLSQNV